jgi:hypothetical protein
MKDLSANLRHALTSPTAEGLWRLRGDLLETGLTPETRTFRVLGEFASFLDELATSTSSREYSHLASMMDIGALGGVVLEQLLEPTSADQLAQRVLAGALSEGLMVLATRQHVKAWEEELDDQKAVLIGHLFQVLLLSDLSRELEQLDRGPGARGSGG